ncbi:MAG: hypothetical protein B7X04_03435 [Parcubacteria group bacterium 21-54-25]|nr:MAG: hypothetical protein B7X04_03435 [Parcubacteria group bacterium 21-54-25]HQU08020.1 hypothetical protein [Candidatus Paceibacterota bacterium]
MRLRTSLVIVLATVLIVPSALFAQTASTTVAVSTRRAQLQSQLSALESQINQSQTTLDTLHSQHESLQRDIDILDTQIKKAKLQVQATEIAIEQLSSNIDIHTQTIGALNTQLSKEQESLAQILRQTQVIDGYSTVDVALSSQNVSSFFQDLDAFASIKQALAQSFTDLTSTRTQTETEKQALEDQLAQQQQLKQIQVLEQRQIQQQEQQKRTILSQTKGKEGAYQSLLNSQQKSAAQIRSELFSLRDSAAIPFGKALQYAETAQKATGVRAAVILGVLKQETDLGQNLGTGNWKVDMAPNRDQPVFVYITKTLGLDPNTMPVSRKPSYGWGGAMGPGQFIPSTWVCYGGFINVNTGDCNNSQHTMSWNAFWQGPWQYVASKDRVRTLTGGNSPSNPWDDQDAFMAAAMLMADNGAAAGTRAAERLAALRYFAGWTHAGNPAYAFYGDGVMGYADQFQQMIDQLNGS